MQFTIKKVIASGTCGTELTFKKRVSSSQGLLLGFLIILSKQPCVDRYIKQLSRQVLQDSQSK